MRNLHLEFGMMALAFAGAVAVAVASCGGDDLNGDDPTRPSQPAMTNTPPPVDAGGGDGDISGCPSVPPRVGEVCPRPEQVEETCPYTTGTCMVGGSTYDKVESYRCFNGNWIKLEMPGPCDPAP